MSVDITIQETINEVDITVNQNVITVNVTRTTGSGGVTSVNGDTGDVVLTTDNVAEGSTNLYFTVARVRATILTGISFVSGAVITATDTVLSALGKLQKQISSIDLPYVLKIGDRVFQEIIGSSYTFEIDDRWKDTLFNGTTDIILDDDADTFPLDSVLSFHVYDTTALFNFTAGTDVRYLGASASADIPIEVGDDCRLKKISTGVVWELIISNKSTGGSVTPSTLISTDADNALVLGLDNKLFVPTVMGGVTSVTGTNVDNTDPLNPVVEAPNLAQVLAIDNKTNDIPIVSNNGKAVVDVNDDYLQIGYDGGGGSSNISVEDIQTTIVGLIATNIYAGTQIQVNAGEYIGISAPAVDIDTPILNYNTEEVATQPWVTSQGYGTGTVTSVTGVGGETTVATGTTTPVIGISSTYTSARDAYADAKVADNLTASTTVAPSKTAVNTALGLKIDKTSWVDYSAISTVVGWSSFITKKISYKILDDAMIVDFDLIGTSNTSTPATFTIPFNAASASFLLSACIANIGQGQNFPGRISTASGSNVITIIRDGQNTAFNNSGTKRCSGQIFIQL